MPYSLPSPAFDQAVVNLLLNGKYGFGTTKYFVKHARDLK